MKQARGSYINADFDIQQPFEFYAIIQCNIYMRRQCNIIIHKSRPWTSLTKLLYNKDNLLNHIIHNNTAYRQHIKMRSNNSEMNTHL